MNIANILESFWRDFSWLAFCVEDYDTWRGQADLIERMVPLRRPGLALSPSTLLINTAATLSEQSWIRDHLILGHGSSPWSYPTQRGCVLPSRCNSDQTPLWNEWWGDVGAALCYWQRTRHTFPCWSDLELLFTPTHPAAAAAGVWLTADSQYSRVPS